MQALCNGRKVLVEGQGSMKQMKQVYNYSGAETWNPGPEVSLR